VSAPDYRPLRRAIADLTVAVAELPLEVLDEELGPEADEVREAIEDVRHALVDAQASLRELEQFQPAAPPPAPLSAPIKELLALPWGHRIDRTFDGQSRVVAYVARGLRVEAVGKTLDEAVRAVLRAGYRALDARGES
jgi:rhodanese-related sulfurtransferase